MASQLSLSLFSSLTAGRRPAGSFTSGLNIGRTKAKTVLDEDEERPAHVCVVYDSKTGRVAHVHEFFGKGFKQDECERMALDTVVKLGHVKPGGLKVLHPPELKFGPGRTLRVDPKSLEIVMAERPDRRRSK